MAEKFRLVNYSNLPRSINSWELGVFKKWLGKSASSGIKSDGDWRSIPLSTPSLDTPVDIDTQCHILAQQRAIMYDYVYINLYNLIISFISLWICWNTSDVLITSTYIFPIQFFPRDLPALPGHQDLGNHRLHRVHRQPPWRFGTLHTLW